MKTFAEFFAGVGLVHEGLSLDDWSCVWANDICHDKKETYVENYGDEHFWLGDVWDLLERSDTVPNNAFLYTASFPCTDLSVAGSRAGLVGKESGTLNALLGIIKTKKESGNNPKIVMLENVKGFLTSNGGSDIANTVRLFSDLGYVVDILELDARLFTPQSRPRVFLFAVENDLAPLVMKLKKKNEFMDIWWSYFNQTPELRPEQLRKIISSNEDLNWGLFDIVPPNQRVLSLSEVIEKTISEDSTLWWDQGRQQHLFSQMSASHRSTLKIMREKNEYSYGTVYRRTRKGKSMAELRTDGFAGCLRTPRGGSSKQILIRAGYGSWNVRLLTPREYARLQGVRDDFVLPKNANKGYFAMGDAVCVPVIKFLSEKVLTPAYQEWQKLTLDDTLRVDCYSRDILPTSPAFSL